MTISSQEDSGAALLYDLDDQSIVLRCKWRVLLCVRKVKSCTTMVRLLFLSKKGPAKVPFPEDNSQKEVPVLCEELLSWRCNTDVLELTGIAAAAKAVAVYTDQTCTLSTLSIPLS